MGRMHSSGSLKVAARQSRNLHVDSIGRPETDGALRLDQSIHWAGGATEHRFWWMKPVGGGRYDVTLSDARGPVFFELHGARAHLRYRDRRAAFALTVEQWMDLQPGGRRLNNVGAVRLFGLPVARLDEVIEHEP